MENKVKELLGILERGYKFLTSPDSEPLKDVLAIAGGVYCIYHFGKKAYKKLKNNERTN